MGESAQVAVDLRSFVIKDLANPLPKDFLNLY